MAQYSTFSDSELADLLKLGDRNAFAEIYNRYKFLLHNHAWNKIRNKQDTQDLVQEVFSMIWSKHETINMGNNLAGYLYRCVHNQFLNMVVHKQVKDKYLDSILHFSQTSPIVTDHLVRENMLKATIENEVAHLPPRMREVFELSRKQHLSHKEIAEIMGTSERTVKKQMGYALKILRKRLGLVLFLATYLLYQRWY